MIEDSLGRWIQLRRKALDLTQWQLALRVGCAVDTIRKIEAGTRRPSQQIATRLADALAVPAPERATFIQGVRAHLSVPQQPTAALPVPSTSSITHGTLASQAAMTFLFTDIVGSTRLWDEEMHAMQAALTRHNAVIHACIQASGGSVFKLMGDSICAVFPHAIDAIMAALAAQRTLQKEQWDTAYPLQVRMALHTGVAEANNNDYVGPPLNRIARMLAVAHGGQIVVSQVTQELVRDHVQLPISFRDLGLYRLKDLRMPERIFQLAAPELPADFAPLAAPNVQATNLPMPLTSLVGRQREIDDLVSLIRSGKRLVTLTGPGGVGKTRLALQLVSLLTPHYPDGVWFVDLSSVQNTLQLTNRVAEILGVAVLPEQNVEQHLQGWLYDKHLLIILDNVEQVPDAALPISKWLRYAAGLGVLTTSRVPLEAIGEQEYPVLPLSLPDLQIIPSTVVVQPSDAMLLFASRVQDIHPHFEITMANQAEVAGICWRLDGLPLALELAAAWTRLFTPKQLLAQLHEQGMLRFLEEKTHKLPPRQQTMYITLAWSYNLLQLPEQTLLSRLAIFRSSWTLDLAELICSDQQGGNGQIGQVAIMHLVARLVEHNLVQQVRNESVQPRFILLETVREFAREQLELRGEEQLIRRRHALAYFGLAAQARERYDRKDVHAFSSVHEDLDSLRAALVWALDHDMIIEATETIIRLAPFWSSRMPVALPWLEDILARADELPPALRANIFALTGSLSWELFRNPVHAQALCEASLALYWELQDYRGVAMVLTGLAHIAVSMGQIDRPKIDAYLIESLTLRRVLGDKAGIAETLSAQGRLAALYGDYAGAHTLMHEALQLQRAVGAPLGIAVALFYLGWLAFCQGNYAEMVAIHSERLTVEQAMGNPQGIADCTLWLGIAALWQGNPLRASQLFESSLQQLRVLGDPWHLPHVIDACAHAAIGRNDYLAAQTYQMERITSLRMLGAQRAIAWSQIHLAFIALDQANYPEALAYFLAAFDVYRENHNPYGPLHLFAVISPQRDAVSLVLLIEGAATLASLTQSSEQALRLAGAATALRATLNIPFYYPDQRDRVTTIVQRARRAGSESSAAWEAGRALTLEQATAEAFDLIFASSNGLMPDAARTA